MQFFALIEYLISGIVASVWVVALVNEAIDLPVELIKDYKEVFVVVYFPIAYILGIYVDVASSFTIRRTKQCILGMCKYCKFRFFLRTTKKAFYFLAGRPKSDSYERGATILAQSPSDMAKTMDLYVSRDRIARGMALNAFVSAFVSLALLPSMINIKAFLICFLVFLISIFVWARLRRLSSRFKRVAIKKLESNP
ncbi:hypothetical protein [Marinobacterium lutimaris]|uniref:Uncharacterized protein n=1 Tax=Marinobacterium lutimaris TaxID=568106 RepID=A0A1H6B673_9GAMM|nr:hypothetical protein [Marinobacterium lutimaris]SEG56343.1 hypothetical protein SAMN05444390_102435 [Marinobacterium lutimaris]